MGDMSTVHLVLVLILYSVLLAVFLVPIALIARKAGYSGWWCLIWFVPIANLVMLWVFAFADWPALRQPRN